MPCGSVIHRHADACAARHARAPPVAVVASQILHAGAQGEDIEYRHGHADVPGPGVHRVATDLLARVLRRHAAGDQPMAVHDRRDAEEVRRREGSAGGNAAAAAARRIGDDDGLAAVVQRLRADAPREAAEAHAEGGGGDARAGEVGLVRALEGEVADRGEACGVREHGARVAHERDAGAAQPRRARRARKGGERAPLRLASQPDRRPGVQQHDDTHDRLTARPPDRPGPHFTVSGLW